MYITLCVEITGPCTCGRETNLSMMGRLQISFWFPISAIQTLSGPRASQCALWLCLFVISIFHCHFAHMLLTSLVLKIMR